MSKKLLPPVNPYTPIWQPISNKQTAVLRLELSRQRNRANWWQDGLIDGLNGVPCRSNQGAYLEGWYDANDYLKS